MVQNLAPELAERGIGINAIAPGGTATDMAAEHGASYTPPALVDWPSQTKLPRSRPFCFPPTRPTSPAPPPMPQADGDETA
jgi:NAD(P)-dependent dehydrogenase (short-subunit alcohol dehydrogenase family)